MPVLLLTRQGDTGQFRWATDPHRHIIFRIHHIGSTSVPELAAKPVIDILLEVNGLTELDNANAAMKLNGYTARGENGIPNRRYFTKGGDQRSHQVHAFAVGDSQIIKHLAFRDYLINNKNAAEQYAEIKRAAVLASDNDVHRYCWRSVFSQSHQALTLRFIGGERASDAISEQQRNQPRISHRFHVALPWYA